MLELLRAVPGARVDRLQTFDVGTDTLRPAQIPAPPDLCFVDGEHTDAAVVRDARFSLPAVATDGCIAFHDSHIIYRGLARFARELGDTRRLQPPRLDHGVSSSAPAR